MEKTVEYKEVLDQVLENTIIYRDQQGNEQKVTEAELRKSYGGDLNENEWLAFKNVSKMLNLNPYKKEIYPARFGGKMQPVVGYQVYLARALKSGYMTKFPEIVITKPNENDRKTWTVKATVKRKDIEDPITLELPVREIDKSQSTWNLMPCFMITKTMSALIVRIGFADFVGDLPYTAEEITSGSHQIDLPEYEGTKIEPSEEERKAKEKADNDSDERKNGNDDPKLPGFQVRINSFDNIKALEIWANSPAVAKHPSKDEILAMVANRKIELTPNEIHKAKDVVSGEIIRSSTINQIVNKTGKSFGDVNSYVSDEMLSGGLIAAVISGEKGAIDEFNEGLSSFLTSQNEPDLGADPEMDIPE